MIHKKFYKTPKQFDDLLMTSDGEYLTGLSFVQSQDVICNSALVNEKELPIFKETCAWLDDYFAGGRPASVPNVKLENATPFREEVSLLISSIPYGCTVTYKDIAKHISAKNGGKKVSFQAVGGAVGWNPICIIIPCHRVVGIDGNLTGYSGGLKNKVELLRLEQNDMNKFSLPKERFYE